MSEPLSENEIEIINRWRLRAQNEYCDQPSAEEDALEEKLATMIDGHSANTVGVPVAAPACERTRDRVQQELEAALDCIDELKIYADPSFYHACAFLFDTPTGGFDQDFSYDKDYKREMPGKTAREAFAKMSEAIAAMPWLSAANCSTEDTRTESDS